MKQFNEVERFIAGYRRTRQTEETDADTTSDQVTELMEFKWWAEQKIRVLEAKLEDDGVEKEQDVSTPVTQIKKSGARRSMVYRRMVFETPTKPKRPHTNTSGDRVELDDGVDVDWDGEEIIPGPRNQLGTSRRLEKEKEARFFALTFSDTKPQAP